MKLVGKKIILIFLFLAGFQTVSLAFPYVIKDYRVKIELQKEGSILVEERILVDFKEERRGIIRSIPFRYNIDPNISGQRAIRNQRGTYYTSVRDISVRNHPFTTYKDGDYEMVRIGDPDVYLTGEVLYVINYKIWGALNEFADGVEFPFNVIGHDWDAPIEKVRFSIIIPDSRKFREEDYKVFTGFRGSMASDVTLQISEREFSGQLTTSLMPYQGVTVGLYFPPGYFDSTLIPMSEFTDTYYAEKIHINYLIQPNGSIDVTEEWDLSTLRNSYHVFREITNAPYDQNIQQFIYPTDFAARRMDKKTDMKLSINRSAGRDRIGMAFPLEPIRNTEKIQFTYTLWGCVLPNPVVADVYDIVIPVSVLTGKEPVKELTYNVRAHKDLEGLLTAYGFKMEGQPAVKITTDRRNEVIQYAVSGTQLFGYDFLVPLSIATKKMDLSNQPYQIYARNYAIKSNFYDITIKPTKSISVHQTLDTDFLNNGPVSTFRWFMPRRISDIKTDTLESLRFPRYNIASTSALVDYSSVKYDTSILDSDRDWEYITWRRKMGNRQEDASMMTLEYDINGVVKNYGNHYRAHLPLAFQTQEPVLKTILKINKDALDTDQPVYIVEGDGFVIHVVSNWDGEQLLDIPSFMRPGVNQYISIPIRSEYIGIGWYDELYMYLVSNKYILYSLGILLFFLLIWTLFGRNRRPLVTVMYYPPETLTPAEIGWLEDDKIHNRDMISLIYYWAAHGYLDIEEIIPNSKRGKPDYRLIKKKDLAGNKYKDYEKTMFNGLFKGRNQVTVSSLKDKFYVHLAKAKKELEKHGRQQDFYVPGTRGFGSCLIALGFFILSGSLLFVGFGLLLEDHSYAVALAILGIGLFIIGRMMPRKGQFGFRKYEKILGFKSFIELAEKDRLRLLLDENPKYFEHTLPYAVAFGMADKWAEKFEGITLAPPSWYRGSSAGKTFDTIRFADAMTQSMNRMSSDMSSRPSSSGSTSGSGGSFRGGGFSSGGGFGGGGGRSW